MDSSEVLDVILMSQGYSNNVVNKVIEDMKLRELCVEEMFLMPRSQSEKRCAIKEKNIRTAVKQSKGRRYRDKRAVPTSSLPYQPQNYNHLEISSSLLILPNNVQRLRFPNNKIDGQVPKGHRPRQQSQQKQGQAQCKSFSRANIHKVSSRLRRIRQSHYRNSPMSSFRNSPLSKQRNSPSLKDTNNISRTPKDQLRIKADSIMSQYLNHSKNLGQIRFPLAKTKPIQIEHNIPLQNQLIQSPHQISACNKGITVKASQKDIAKISSYTFVTKLKRKCLESDPHLLATVIKRKSQQSPKEHLYQFIAKIIAKSKKN